MFEFWASFTFIQKLFAYCAGFGSLFFVIRAISLIMGACSGANADLDGDGVPDALEHGGAGMADLDGDGIPDVLESGSGLADLDGNGIPDVLESGSGLADLDGNGIPDVLESGGLADLDGNGIPDVLEHGSGALHGLPNADGGDVSHALEDTSHDGLHMHANKQGDSLGSVFGPDDKDHHAMPEKIPFFKQFLSMQNLSMFFMMFGWVGLAMMCSSGFSATPAVLAGIAAGLIFSSILMKITNSLMKLSRSGTARVSSAIGKTGRVYLRIPANGDGQIEVDVDGRLKVCDAISSDGSEIKTDSQVLVIDIQKSGEKEILVVKALQ